MRVRVLLACTRWGDTVMTHRTIALLVTLTLVLLMVPRAPDAQPPAKIARVGYFSLQGEDHSLDMQAFQQGLRDLGYVDGTNLVTAFHFATGKSEQLPTWPRNWSASR
jgi:hypothetical protein